MGYFASDHETVINLVIDGYRLLQGINPSHELLAYLSDVTDSGFRFVPERYEDFLDRFDPGDLLIDAAEIQNVLLPYYVALRDAADKLEKNALH